MNARAEDLDDLGLAALISSKICHDVISPVGAISNGLEVLDEESDDEMRAIAMDLIRRSADQASAKLQFARLAFGAAGSAGSEIGIQAIEDVSVGILDADKHQMRFDASISSLAKDKVKLLLNLITVSISTLPRGGQIMVGISGQTEAPIFVLRADGDTVRYPEKLHDVLNSADGLTIDSQSLQPYYTSRIAAQSGMTIKLDQAEKSVILNAFPST